MSALEQRGNGFCLTGRANWSRRLYGQSHRVVVADVDLLEAIRDRFELHGEQPIGQVRITVEMLEDETAAPPANAPNPFKSLDYD